MLRTLPLLSLLLLISSRLFAAEPRWLSEPNYDPHYNGASACSHYRDAPIPALAEQIATVYARRELAQSLGSQVESTFERLLLATGTQQQTAVKRAVRDEILLQSSTLLRGSRIAAKWSPPQADRICVWVVMPQATLDKWLNDELPQQINTRLP